MAPKRKRGAAGAPKRRQAATTSATNGASNTTDNTASAANNAPISRRTRARAAVVEPVDDPEAILRRSKRRRVTPAPVLPPPPPPAPASSASPPPPLSPPADMPVPISKTGGLLPRRRYARTPPGDASSGATPTPGTKPTVFPGSSSISGTKPGLMPPAAAQDLHAQQPAAVPSSSSSDPSSSSSSAPASSSSPAAAAPSAAPAPAPEAVQQQQTLRVNLAQRDISLYRASISTQVTYLNTPTELKLVLEIRTCPAGYRTRLQYHASLFLQNNTLHNAYIGYINGSRLSKPSRNRPHVDPRRWVQEWWRGEVVDLPDSCNSMAKTLRVLYEKIGDDSVEPCYDTLSDEHGQQLSDSGNEIVYISNIRISPDYSRNGLGGIALDQYYRLLMGQTLPAWYAFNGPVTFILMPGLICDDEVTRFWSRQFPDIDYDSPMGEWNLIDAVSTYLIAWYERHGYEIFIHRGVFEDGAGVVMVRGIMGRQMNPIEFTADTTARPGSDDNDNLPIPPTETNTSPPIRNVGDSSSSSTGGSGGSGGRGNTAGQRGRQTHTPGSPSPANQPQSSSPASAFSELPEDLVESFLDDTLFRDRALYGDNPPPAEETEASHAPGTPNPANQPQSSSSTNQSSELPEESFLDDTLFGDRALYGDNPPPEEQTEAVEDGAGTQDDNDVSAIAHIAGTDLEEQAAIESVIMSSLAQSAPQGPQAPDDGDDDNNPPAPSSETSIENLSYEEQLALVMQRSLQDISASAQDPAQAVEHSQDQQPSNDAPEVQPEQQPEAQVADDEGLEISTETFLARTKPWIAPNSRRPE